MNREKALHPALVLVFLALVVTLTASSSQAAVRGALFGPRIGLSQSPDQMVLGGQIEFPEFAQNLTVDPNVELGVLDNQTDIAMNADIYYHFAIQNSAWAPYAGMGLGINVAQFDRTFDNSSETNAGANVVLGASVPTRAGNRFFGELRVGLGDIPQMKLMAGWNFGM